MTELEKNIAGIGNYIHNEYSICREERQYALFVYNILRFFREPESRNNTAAQAVFDACQIPMDAKVTDVFYEVSFMRDFFERNRRLVLGRHDTNKLLNKSFKPADFKIKNAKKDSFNYKLIEYVLGGPGSMDSTMYLEEERNLGRNPIRTKLSDSPKENGERKFIIQCMMNVKPDIAVLYQQNGETYLLFLECKFETGEVSYSNEEDSDADRKINCSEDRDGSGKGGTKPAANLKISQRKIHWMIADFLCGSYFKGDLKVAGPMEKEKNSCLIRFVRRKEQDEKASGKIWICDLINLNAEIFH